MITFIQFLESVEDETQKDAFIDHFQLNVDEKKGMYANMSVFDTDKIENRLKTWNKYIKMNDADKNEIRRIIRSKSSKLIDLYNAFYKKANRETEESAPPSPKS
jgi:hypothetical protein